ncbi:MAG: Gfo/Idh/MocA family oxidoreductase [Planctomycetota bacterium]
MADNDTTKAPSDDDYATSTDKADLISAPAPPVDYKPRRPKSYRPKIGLVGCGGISASHLKAYKSQGYDVPALVDIKEDAAISRRDEFYPGSIASTDHSVIMDDPAIDVVDVALHPADRPPVIEEALRKGKHVLSQKPFAIDLDVAESLAKLAEEQGRILAVNQNGRWSPNVSYARNFIDAGHLGEVQSIEITVNWDHSWTVGTIFETLPHLILYDFAVHWFDMIRCYAGDKTWKTAIATTTRFAGQKARPSMGAQVLLQGDGIQATLVFNADHHFGFEHRSIISGTKAGLLHASPDLDATEISLVREKHHPETIPLEGAWFPDGFIGTMGELLCAIEEGRAPQNSARHNLHTLEMVFAAIASAESKGKPVAVGSVRRLEPAWLKFAD